MKKFGHFDEQTWEETMEMGLTHNETDSFTNYVQTCQRSLISDRPKSTKIYKDSMQPMAWFRIGNFTLPAWISLYNF